VLGCRQFLLVRGRARTFHSSRISLLAPSSRLALVGTGALSAHARLCELCEEVAIVSALLALAHYALTCPICLRYCLSCAIWNSSPFRVIELLRPILIGLKRAQDSASVRCSPLSSAITAKRSSSITQFSRSKAFSLKPISMAISCSVCFGILLSFRLAWLIRREIAILPVTALTGGFALGFIHRLNKTERVKTRVICCE